MGIWERLSDRVTCDRVQEKLRYLAWRKYYLRAEDADDIIQTSLATYLEVKDRYGPDENHNGILMGIFNNKCLEFLDRRSKERRRLRHLARTPDARRKNPRLDPEGHGAARGALEEIVKREDGREILATLAQLRPQAKKMFHLMVEEELGRKGLLDHFQVNKNTLDSRLRVFRMELMTLLRKKGIVS